MLLRLVLVLIVSAGIGCSSSQAQEMGEVQRPQVYEQVTYHVDWSHKEVVPDTHDFNMTAYKDHAAALATGCQIFKEKDQDLWWANCGRPITGFTVISNMSDN